MVLAALVFPEQNQVSQEYQLLQEVLDDQETLVAQEVPSCLRRLRLVCLGSLGGQVAPWPPFLHSGQETQGPLEGL